MRVWSLFLNRKMFMNECMKNANKTPILRLLLRNIMVFTKIFRLK